MFLNLVVARLLSIVLVGIFWSAPMGCEESSAAVTTTASASPTTITTEERRINDDYAQVLRAVVTEDGLVRYDQLKDEEMRRTLDAVVKAYAQAEIPATTNERIALWANAYNANVLQRIARARAKPGFKRVIDISGFFDSDLITVTGDKLTLNDLENKKIRPISDARIHAALVCAAISCPPLRNEPYTGDELESQLDDQARRWVNDATRFTARGGRLGVSSILDWYADDFKEQGPAGFVRRFAREDSDLARLLEKTSDPPVDFLEYDWSLNLAG